MKKKCSICQSVEDYETLYPTVCSKCGAPGDFLEDSNQEEIKEKVLKNAVVLAKDNPSVERILEKCIDCGRCQTVCRQLVGISYDDKKAKEAICIHCGQCILNCPVGALVPKYTYKKVLDYLHDTNKIVTISIAPAVRVALGEAFGMEAGSFVEGQMVKALRLAGFDYVFDVTFGADMTIMEEASELLERIKQKSHLPMFTSCCPAWVSYAEIYHPELLENLSTTKSPISIQSALLNSYFLQMQNIKRDDILHVVVVPCTAKKYEIKKEELAGMDIAITTSELALLLKESNISLNNLPTDSFDKMFSKGSGAGIIFGGSGGVMEAALRTAYYFVQGTNPPNHLLSLQETDIENVKEADVTIGNYHLKVAVVYGMPAVEKLLASNKNYDFVEVMNCPQGCVGGGGQPLSVVSQQEMINHKRKESLYQADTNMNIRCSYENPDVKDVYRSYLSCPLSDKAKELLHTHYKNKSAILGEISP